MRHQLTLPCRGQWLAATLDVPARAPDAALLIVSGGREPRCGPHSSMARLAASLAGQGIATMRFDRRGVGDSTGSDPGYADAVPDIAAAHDALRAAIPPGTRIIAFGNCDAATALALSGIAFDRLVLANPWTLPDGGEDGLTAPALPPPAAIRARYAHRLRDPATYRRALAGDIDWRRLFKGLWALRPGAGASPRPAPSLPAQRLADGIANAAAPVTVLVAEQDRTAQHFLAECAPMLPPGTPIMRRNSASHGFASGGDATWLQDRLIAACRA